jgi:AcrR family transcriptional regulator
MLREQMSTDPEYSEAPAARPRRDSAATRRRLLAAATAEFAERGIAGARVDRIASAAQANKRLIYDYFGDKDGLFDAVTDANLERIIDAVPIDATDLPGYAGRLFTYAVEHPELLRLVTWARLERRLGPNARTSSAQSYRHRLAVIEGAQRSGHIPTTFTPPQLLTLIESIAVGWVTTTAPFVGAGEDDPSQHHETHREVIVETVRRLLT